MHSEEKKNLYSEIYRQMVSLLEETRFALPSLSNCSALVYSQLPDLNWCGFYILHQNELILGPFQGNPACIRIAPGKGVCGTALQKQTTICVENVHLFPGHIACDARSNSEIVIPLFDADHQIRGVFDLDSPQLNRFDTIDQEGLEELCSLLQSSLSWEPKIL